MQNVKVAADCSAESAFPQIDFRAKTLNRSTRKGEQTSLKERERETTKESFYENSQPTIEITLR